MDELWKDVIGYEGIYQVSNLGNLKFVSHTVKTKDGEIRTYKEREKKIWVSGGNTQSYRKGTGYYMACLSNQGTRKFVYLHILVAQAFIPNPDHLPCVNHKDENKLNNRVSNLEWCTHKYNSNYGSMQQKLQKAVMKARLSKKCLIKPVYQYKIDGTFIRVWDSAKEAAHYYTVSSESIRSCVCGKSYTCCGFIWLYDYEEEKIKGRVSSIKDKYKR